MVSREVGILEAKLKLTQPTERVAGKRERFALVRKGRRVAGLVTAEDLELLEYMEAQSDGENHIQRFAGKFRGQRHWAEIESLLAQAREASKGETPIVLG
ncbi:MAG: hypothetical protein AUJ92_13665 [Armatimonadetes bacterium CG2_30_59_28]|nr:hypothetical protein [Armatimonadota bacterium]OIO92697.1 MAG: hypothetical protein AUJ92_13665 [Armatimonadetes bacterium CG2_30_59_28]PIU65108.1 MAG: hypothetical protein COS85_10055 [Armatimonadetes bacterium CG07_land_8_20_14_0_80_59_28]PIX43435.1 MAG: hypothetical protein COZ56_07140 [Armatimonadetes bacterium CG_4_8_14_3_um_filter_58_9]PIY39614.1 MAG: hypothetical protein COZ05_18995 [Armatimonadetes bacterium CG_4_10_14_3_um_filter_59_10]